MTDTAFPCTDDDLSKANLRSWVQRVGNSLNYVNNGFNVTASTGLSCNVAAGEAVGAGVWMKRDVLTNVGLFASATNYVYVRFDDTQRNTLLFTVNTTGVPPDGNSVLLAIVVTSATVVTSITDKRPLSAQVSRWRTP